MQFVYLRQYEYCQQAAGWWRSRIKHTITKLKKNIEIKCSV